MSDQIEIIYFLGCPNAAVVFETLKKNRIPFGLVIQDRLPKDDPKRALSSPSVLVNGTQVIGEKSKNGSASCSLTNLSEDTILAAVRSVPSTQQRLV